MKTFEQIAKEAAERFPELPPVDDSTIMWFGQYKGEMMCDIPDAYLKMVHDKLRPDARLKTYIVTRLSIPSFLNDTGNMTREEILKSKL